MDNRSCFTRRIFHTKTHQFSHSKAQSPQKRRNKKPHGGTMLIEETPNLWFPCGWPFTKTTEITKATKMTKTTKTAAKKELSAGLAEITETTEMTKTTGIRLANHGFPKPLAWKYLTTAFHLSQTDFKNVSRHTGECRRLWEPNRACPARRCLQSIPFRDVQTLPL